MGLVLLMQSWAMVTKAKQWINLPNQLHHTIIPLLNYNNGSSINVLRILNSNISYLEHVIVQLSLQLIQLPNEEPLDDDDYYNALYHNKSRRGDV